MKDKIPKWFEQGLWTERMVHNAVLKGVISEVDYQKIVGAAAENLIQKIKEEP